MRLSIRLVALLTGLAKAMAESMQDYERGALQEYCGSIGLEPDTINLTREGYTGTCRGSRFDVIQSPEALGEFCGRLFMIHHGYQYLPDVNQLEVKCTWLAANEELTRVMAELVDEEGNVDQGKLRTRLLQQAKVSPANLISWYNAINASPSTTKSMFGLGGGAGTASTVAGIAYSFITINAEEKGLFGPETEVGRKLRENPIYGPLGTQPSPFGYSGTVKWGTKGKWCVLFKDKSSLKKCDRNLQRECDTSYAHDDATDIGNELWKRCLQEHAGEKEYDCIQPRLGCKNYRNGAFQYCMDDSETNRMVCELFGWGLASGRAKTPAELEKEKEERLQSEEAGCFYPRMSCRNVYGKFLHCMSSDRRSVDECKQWDWRPQRQPKRSDQCVKIKSVKEPNSRYYTAFCEDKAGNNTMRLWG